VKTVRRYLAWTVFVVIWLAFLPVAVIRKATDWLYDSLICPLLDSLEAIIHE